MENPELYCLTLMSVFYLLAWFPGSVGKYLTYGLGWLLSNRDSVNLPPLPGWKGRADRAYANLKDYFPAYVVAIFLLVFLEGLDESTAQASWVYLVTRLGHFLAYLLGIVHIRAVLWFISLCANLFLFYKVLSLLW